MADIDPPDDGPSPDEFAGVFRVYETRRDGDQLLYYGQPLDRHEAVIQEVWPIFREAGYEVQLTTKVGEYVLVAEPRSVGVDGIPWTNVVLALATVVSTLYAGARWHHANPFEDPAAILEGWPFMLGVMGVLGVHEFGHYALSRYHDVDASLPYFIPIPISFIGTLGAVIRMRGHMPDRKALFDIGVAGPLAGLVATVIVTTIGLYLPPIHVPQEILTSEAAVEIQFGYPLLLHFLSWATGQPLRYADPTRSVNPVVIAGWVGMFVTFLNLIPVGQLDGGHILRAIVGEDFESLAPIVPTVLFGLAGYLYFARDGAGVAVSIWLFWGVFATVFTVAGAATPIEDSSIDRRRIAIGVLTLLLGLLSFHPIPVQIMR